ncbi:hypothetical protein TIFTF001_020903 [Ficus carica]|uniref:RNase H type-1 domain-containing protein n=1 Tax=Ficus carica TaxID=3494 RepID=A0AA88DJP5_FICCA|nr:hypothetical protein TIFTF001_020903 [Ficus carica]
MILKAFNNLFPCAENLVKRGVNCEGWWCGFCREVVESTWHGLWSCPFARHVWEDCALWPKLCSSKECCFDGLLLFATTKPSTTDLEIFLLIAWAIWSARNLRLFEATSMTTSEALDMAGRMLFCFQDCNKLEVAECIALREGLEFSELCGLKVDFVESDAVNVVRAVNSPESLYVIISDIRKCLVASGGSVCSHVPRKGNMGAVVANLAS